MRYAILGLALMMTGCWMTMVNGKAVESVTHPNGLQCGYVWGWRVEPDNALEKTHCWCSNGVETVQGHNIVVFLQAAESYCGPLED